MIDGYHRSTPQKCSEAQPSEVSYLPWAAFSGPELSSKSNAKAPMQSSLPRREISRARTNGNERIIQAHSEKSISIAKRLRQNAPSTIKHEEEPLTINMLSNIKKNVTYVEIHL